MKFIKLTEVTGLENKIIYINFDNVMSFSIGMKGKDTHIRMYDKSFFFVKEKIEEIEKMLYPPAYREISTANAKSLGLI